MRSALESTNNQIHKDTKLKNKPSHSIGVSMILKINLRNLTKCQEKLKLRELIVDFKRVWLIVSQILVRAIKERTKNKLAFITLPLSSLYCLGQRR